MAVRTATIFITLAVLFGVVWAPPVPIHGAPPPVDLELSGSGASSWNIANIKPGDSGAQMLTLRNTGYANGVLNILVSDIADTKATNPPSVPFNPDEPEELSKHLLFRPISNRLSTNIPMPATINDFPKSVSDTAKITISPIAPGETIDLAWEWRLPSTVGNAVQGNKLSFTINYTLVEMPVTPVDGGGASPQTSASPFIITSPEKQMALTVYRDGTIAETQTIAVITNLLTLGFERGTRIVTEDNSVPNELRVTLREDAPAPPPGTVIIGPVYELLFYTARGPQPVMLSQPARMILNYDMTNLPPRVTALFI